MLGRLPRFLLPLTIAVGAIATLSPERAAAAKRDPDAPKLGELVERVRQSELVVVEAERAAAKEVAPSEAELAKRLVEGQLKVSEGDYEGGAIVFLDLVENYSTSGAGPQAVYYLGDALTYLGMERWAVELFSKNLSDSRAEARRYHQLSVARLFDLALPRRESGFARRPGLSATPEVRARLESVGVDTSLKPKQGIVKDADAERLTRWADSFPRGDRREELRYSYGRYLYLTGENAKAVKELDSLSPLDIPMSRGGRGAKWRVRSAYVAASAVAGLKEYEEALERFGRITKARPRDPRDRQIVELAWLAIGRIHHDTGEAEDAVKAYRRVGRDSPFFPEAMYETAWTLLAGGQYEQAVGALDLLLIYDPRSPIAPEIKQLRGKVKIQQRDYQGAEEEFLELRRQFDRLGKRLGRKLSKQGDATAYFSAVVSEDMEHFSLDSILPIEAVPIARALDSAAHAEALAKEVGHLERELSETRDLLARMEEAVQATEKARLFSDFGAHVASLDNVDDDLIGVREELVFRLAGGAKGSGLDRMEKQRKGLRLALDEPMGTTGKKRREIVARLQVLQEQVHKMDLFIGAMRAELVATERYYDETRSDQKIDHQGFLKQAAEARDAIAALEKEAIRMRDKVSRAQAGLRYRDPLRAARQKAQMAYRKHLVGMYGALAKVSGDPDANTVFKRVQALQARADKTRAMLERSAGNRLAGAMEILVEERANLDSYLTELKGVRGTSVDLVGTVMAAAYRDVVGELGNLTMRSEVGLLDVAWSMKEAETEQIQRLETERDRDLREVDRAIDMGLEDLQ